MSNDVSTATTAILPFVLAAVLVVVFILWRPEPLRRLFGQHGRALRWAAVIAAIVLAAGGHVVRIG